MGEHIDDEGQMMPGRDVGEAAGRTRSRQLARIVRAAARAASRRRATGSRAVQRRQQASRRAVAAWRRYADGADRATSAIVDEGLRAVAAWARACKRSAQLAPDALLLAGAAAVVANPAASAILSPPRRVLIGVEHHAHRALDDLGENSLGSILNRRDWVDLLECQPSRKGPCGAT
ncbi:MAG: hypothetical protein U1F67_04285 [Rubrivivax sp.]